MRAKKQRSIFETRSKKPELIKTLEFLGESCASWKDVKKKDCAHRLVYRIQTLMPEECGVCNVTYTVKKTDTSLLACSICGHEAHHKCYKSLLEKNEDLSKQNEKIAEEFSQKLEVGGWE